MWEREEREVGKGEGGGYSTGTKRADMGYQKTSGH